MDARSKMADIVLPVTSSLERNDIGGSSRDRYVLAMHQAIAPQHQARHDFDIFADLADRLGYRETFTEGRDEMAWIRHIYQECGAAQRSHDVEWPDFETFGNKGMSVYLLPPKHLCSLILSVKTHRLIHYRPRVAKLNYLVKNCQLPIQRFCTSCRVETSGRMAGRSAG